MKDQRESELHGGVNTEEEAQRMNDQQERELREQEGSAGTSESAAQTPSDSTASAEASNEPEAPATPEEPAPSEEEDPPASESDDMPNPDSDNADDSGRGIGRRGPVSMPNPETGVGGGRAGRQGCRPRSRCRTRRPVSAAAGWDVKGCRPGSQRSHWGRTR